MLPSKFTSLAGPAFVIGLVLGAALTLWFSPSNSIRGIISHSISNLTQRDAKIYRKAQNDAAKVVKDALKKTEEAHRKRVVAETNADEAEKVAADAFDAAEKARFLAESAATAAEEAQRLVKYPDVILDPSVADTLDKMSHQISTLKASADSYQFAFEKQKEATEAERYVNKQLVFELESTQDQANAYKRRYELAEDRVKQLSKRRVRWGPGVFVGVDHNKSPMAGIGLTIAFSK